MMTSHPSTLLDTLRRQLDDQRDALVRGDVQVLNVLHDELTATLCALRDGAAAIADDPGRFALVLYPLSRNAALAHRGAGATERALSACSGQPLAYNRGGQVERSRPFPRLNRA